MTEYWILMKTSAWRWPRKSQSSTRLSFSTGWRQPSWGFLGRRRPDWAFLIVDVNHPDVFYWSTSTRFYLSFTSCKSWNYSINDENECHWRVQVGCRGVNVGLLKLSRGEILSGKFHTPLPKSHKLAVLKQKWPS